jgi:uncharacterized protein YbjT (DUF2867 family)
MRILLTGANGYIGLRLLHRLLEDGHEVMCAVRSADRLSVSASIRKRIRIVEVDFLRSIPENLPTNIDAAYYLIHSMGSSSNNFEYLERESAHQFASYISTTDAEQVIYLGGISNQPEDSLSPHLRSRRNVEHILQKECGCSVTVLRAGIIVGSGSASFEIIRDLTEKLPVMITPKWVMTKTQPIAIRDVLNYLAGVLGQKQFYNHTYDIAGPDILTYRDMMLQFAEERKIKRWIYPLPVMTPKLSSYWLYFVTSTSYQLAQHLVDSMKVEVIARPNNLREHIKTEHLPYRKAVQLAFQRIKQNEVVSSWKDSITSSLDRDDLVEHIEVPQYGCFKDEKELTFNRSANKVLENVWAIGGERGWYYADTLWEIRGFLDKLAGGVGLRRGRRSPTEINTGDALDFWRVVVADRKEMRLLLYAEMKLPGEAWLEFKIEPGNPNVIHQTATFRPLGLLGRLYWFSVLPFHYFIFNRMIRRIVSY